MYKTSVIALVSLLITLNVVGQNKTVKFEDLEALQAAAPKPVVVLIMTDWCKYCHAMQNTLLKNQQLAPLLSAKFRTVFLNAEEKRDIIFAGRTFRYRSGINELARQLATNNGEVSYPAICILNSRNEIIYQHDGYLSAQAMLFMLKNISAN